MAKKVFLHSGKVFTTISSAKKYYADLCREKEAGVKLSEPDRSDVLDIYHRYCQLTNWDELNSAVDVIVVWGHNPWVHGPSVKTKAFAIVSSSGLSAVFSIGRALTKLAV